VKRSIAVLVLAGGLTIGPSLTPVAAQAEWPEMTSGGWVSAGRNDRAEVFVKLAPAGSRPRAWVRMEYPKPHIEDGLTTSSVVFLQEFDCARRQTRALEFRAYARNNMQDVRERNISADVWRASSPNSVGAVVVDMVCGAGGDAASSPAASAAPAGPASAWPKIVEGAWALFGEGEDIKLYATLWSPTTWTRGWLRYEFLQPQEAPAGAYRSARTLVEYDCINKLSRAVLEVRYAEPNLGGAIDMSAPVGRWEKFDMTSGEGDAAEAICRGAASVTAELAAEQAARGEPAMSLQQLATALDRDYGHVRTGDWHGVPPTTTGKLFVRGTAKGAYPQVEVRWEYLTPLTLAGEAIKSSWHVVEMNCATFQYRFAQTVGYPQSNLKGVAIKVAPTPDWLPMSGDYTTLRMICDRQLEADPGGALA
jgi:hypothetical protein